jgi:alpha-glucosidase (family GH31 glycosyl hydrolase)
VCRRSTFPGAGRFTGHWTGDNGANWQSFADSVASILAPNMWGISMVGADICGFVDMDAYNGNGKDMDPPKFRLNNEDYQQLCNRWVAWFARGLGCKCLLKCSPCTSAECTLGWTCVLHLKLKIQEAL